MSQLFSSLVFRRVLLLVSFCFTSEVFAQCHSSWEAWHRFKQNLVSEDGRVIDFQTPTLQTTSEGQSYGLFFALVANDPASFQKILKWTESNLAANDLSARLPAWHWGKKPDQTWGIIDDNSAMDSDLWIAYTLAQAGEIWKEKRYTALSKLMMMRIMSEEVTEIPNLGLSLLPAPKGFKISERRYKLNPSYLPLQLLRWAETTQGDARWNKITASSIKLLLQSAPKGFSPDWIVFDSDQGFLPDWEGTEKGFGGYNAIRVYLWAGMLDQREPERLTILKHFQPMARLIEQRGTPPEWVNIVTGENAGTGSSGFSAAMLPFLYSLGQHQLLAQQRLRLEAQPIGTHAYYDHVLALFAQGWLEKRYRFDAHGRLKIMPTCK